MSDNAALFYGALHPPDGGKLEVEYACAALVSACKMASNVLPDCYVNLTGSVLIRTSEGFTLTGKTGIDTSLLNNDLLLHKFEGAICIKKSDGYKPLLILAMIQNEIRKKCGISAISLTDASGKSIIPLDNFDDMESVFMEHGFDYQEARRYAVALGLTKELVNLAGIEADSEDHFF